MIQSAINNVIVKFKTKYIKNFTTIGKIAAIQNNTSIEPADMVNIVCEVVSAPKSIDGKREHKGFSLNDIRPGDVAIVSHLVIFNFELTASEEEPIFKNRIWYQGEEYFQCDIQHLFAVIRDGEVKMLNGYVMVGELQKPSQIFLPAHVKKSIRTAQAIVSHIGTPLLTETKLDVKTGDKVYFNPSVVQLYQVNEKPFGIIRQRDILGRSVPQYSDVATLN